MNQAAIEMAHPPREIGRAKAALLAQALAGIGYVVVAVNAGEVTLASVSLFLTTWLFHFVACAFFLLSAQRMHRKCRKWWRYMSWQAVIPFGGPMLSLLYLQHFRDSR